MKTARTPILRWYGNAREERKLAQTLFAETACRARAPVFFTELCVADTMDGRFDLLTLHVWLVMERLVSHSHSLSQAFIDEIFLGFEEALRELGTGDVGMTRRLKMIGNAFYGRLAAYRGAKDVSDLTDAVARNVYRSNDAQGSEARALATYASSARSHLAKAKIGHGELDFGPLPGAG